jgi:hypothetical protein
LVTAMQDGCQILQGKTDDESPLYEAHAIERTGQVTSIACVRPAGRRQKTQPLIVTQRARADAPGVCERTRADPRISHRRGDTVIGSPV